MKKVLLGLIGLALSMPLFAQKKYYTKTGRIQFAAGTSVEDIDAVNNSAASVFDAGTGQIEYAVLIKGFEFKRSLMQEHFNENYLESDKYPKAVFKGKIVNISEVNFQRNGVYPVTVKGILDMHGVQKEVETAGAMQVSGETVNASATFNVALADYRIDIPGVVKDKISEKVKISVQCNYQVLK